MKNITIVLTLMLSLFAWQASAQKKSAKMTISHLEPAFWWVGMQNPNLQLLVHGANISTLTPTFTYAGVVLKNMEKVENPNYLFINIEIAKDAKAGSFTIDFKDAKGKTAIQYVYQLKERAANARTIESFNPSDVIYLITPDRFANGNKANDQFENMPDKLNRTAEFGRHGGDLQGISNHLDYLKDMGFTALWLNPIVENNMPESSYHGYAITDYYKVDPRFGTNEEYLKLTKDMQAKGMKMIMDMVMNHCGANHWWMKDLPTKDWVNYHDNYRITSHRRTVLQDPHTSQADAKIFSDGWFVSAMPDLNQRNKYMATYLIQNSIWWIEYLRLDGIRHDTHPYPDKNFMSLWSKSILDEYPNYNIVGEEWTTNHALVAQWQKGKINSNGYVSYMPSMMDFPVQNALREALMEHESWGGGLIKLYETLAMDFLYADPYNLVIFPDNHDMSRIFSQLNENVNLYKMAMAYIFTTRGIPQIFYGTEILMHNRGTDSHGIIRSDFAGGWEGDKVNAFTGENLTAEARDAQLYVKKILNWRKTATAIHKGKMLHFAPENGVYVYFRYTDNQKVMVILNKNNADTKLNISRFAEIVQEGAKAKNIINDNEFTLANELIVPANSPIILEIK